MMRPVFRLCYFRLRYFHQQPKFLSQVQPSESSSNENEQNRITLLNDLLKKDKSKPVVNLSNTKGITVKHIKKETENSAIFRYCLEKEPSLQGFINATEIFKNKSKNRHGHIEFISTGIKFIEPYGLEKNAEVYNALLDIFPRDRFDNKTLFDAVWPKAHPQIDLALDILTKMEWQGISPPDSTFDIVYSIFGRASFPVHKIYRMWFWFDEFKDLNPYRLPDDVYKDRISVFKAVTERLFEDTEGFKVLELSTPMENSSMTDYQHFLISSQTPKQKKYVSLCIPNQTLYIEGPTHIWINHRMEEYFVLKAGKNGFLSDGIHLIDHDEQKEGVVLAMCFSSKPYKTNIQNWWQYLQETNPSLRTYNVVFNVPEDIMVDSNKQIEPPDTKSEAM